MLIMMDWFIEELSKCLDILSFLSLSLASSTLHQTCRPHIQKLIQNDPNLKFFLSFRTGTFNINSLVHRIEFTNTILPQLKKGFSRTFHGYRIELGIKNGGVAKFTKHVFREKAGS